MKKVLLYSGGTDSWLIRKLWNPDILLYVDMDTKYSDEELEKIDRLGRPDNLVVHKLPLGQFEDKDTAFIPMRNLYLLMVASHYGEELCLGATKEDAGGSADKDLAFLNDTEKMLVRLWGKQSLFDGKPISIKREFAQYTKGQLLERYLKEGGDIETFKRETFSCYTPQEGKECLACKACFRKFVECYDKGAGYTRNELEKMYNFVEENVVHESHHAQGRYFMEKKNSAKVFRVLTKLYKELGKELNLK